MSCNSLNQQVTLLNATVGALPEGFCPSSMQELSEAIVSRLIVTPNTAFTSFAIGSQEPSSNVGPWLKNCEEWFVFDDNTASYIPIEKGGFNEMQYFTSSGSFIVPAFIYKLRVKIWGGGGGGGGVATQRSGGGGGGFAHGILNVLPGETINFTVGLGGAGVAAGSGGAGGTTTFKTMTALGGGGGGVGVVAGFGGGANGGTQNIKGQNGEQGVLVGEGTGNGGSSPQGGGGGTDAYPNAVSAYPNGDAPGGGGGGSYNVVYAVGSGANGAVLIEY